MGKRSSVLKLVWAALLVTFAVVGCNGAPNGTDTSTSEEYSQIYSLAFRDQEESVLADELDVIAPVYDEVVGFWMPETLVSGEWKSYSTKFDSIVFQFPERVEPKIKPFKQETDTFTYSMGLPGRKAPGTFPSRVQTCRLRCCDARIAIRG